MKTPEKQRRKENALVTARTLEEYKHKLMLNEARLDAAENILDVCAGNSTFAREVNEQAGYNKVTALDAKATELGLDPEYSVDGHAENLQFDDNTFDLTVMSWGTEYMTRDEASCALKEMIRVTKPGGKVKIFGTGLDVSDVGRNECRERVLKSDLVFDVPRDGHGTIPANAVLSYDKPEVPEEGLEDALQYIYDRDLLRPDGGLYRKLLFVYGAIRSARQRRRSKNAA